jgi:hypothetical protein
MKFKLTIACQRSGVGRPGCGRPTNYPAFVRIRRVPRMWDFQGSNWESPGKVGKRNTWTEETPDFSKKRSHRQSE